MAYSELPWSRSMIRFPIDSGWEATYVDLDCKQSRREAFNIFRCEGVSAPPPVTGCRPGTQVTFFLLSGLPTMPPQLG
jgi:hypothetical protein